MKRSICLILACILILFLSGILSKAESKTLTGTLYYRDAPMSTLTEASPQFWFYNGNTYEYPILTTHYDPTNSTYEILDCPETTNFLIDVSFPGEYGSNTDLPKSYNRQIRLDTTTLDSQDIQLYYNIHLLTPYDNSNVNMYYPPSPYPTHNSPVQFSWEAVTGADSYQIKIQRTRDPDNPEGGYGDIETIINENTTSLTYTADIPSSASFEHYEFSLSAYENGSYLGHYTTLYIGAHGSDYRFKISKKKSKFMPWLMLLLDDEPERNSALICFQAYAVFTSSACQNEALAAFEAQDVCIGQCGLVQACLDGCEGTLWNSMTSCHEGWHQLFDQGGDANEGVCGQCYLDCDDAFNACLDVNNVATCLDNLTTCAAECR